MEQLSQSRRRPESASKFDSIARTGTVAAVVVEQRWHWKGVTNTGIWDLDMHPWKKQLLTCGGDGRTIIWGLRYGGDTVMQTCADFFYTSTLVPSLASNLAGCNAAKWSPTGDYIVTGNDAGVICIWRRCSKPYIQHNDVGLDTEYWRVAKTMASMHCRGAVNEVTALAWSSDQRNIIGTAMSGAVCVWDVASGAVRQTLLDHTERSCGVAVHPIAPDFVTLGDDQKICAYRMIRGESLLVRVQNSDATRGLLAQDRYRAWVRRAAWSPDGIFLLVPASFQKLKRDSKKKKPSLLDDDSDDVGPDCEKELLDGYLDVQGCHVYIKGKYERALGFIPAPAHLTPVCAEFCPRLFRHVGAVDPVAKQLWGDLPYRLVFAVAFRHRGSRRNDIMLYDTAHTAPLVEVTNISLSAVSSIVWSHEGCDLFTASQDGYVATVHFTEGTLGETVTEADGPAYEVEKCVNAAKVEMRKEATKTVTLMQERTRLAKLKKRQKALEAAEERKAQTGSTADPTASTAAPSEAPGVNVLQIKKRKKQPVPDSDGKPRSTPKKSSPAKSQLPPPALDEKGDKANGKRKRPKLDLSSDDEKEESQPAKRQKTATPVGRTPKKDSPKKGSPSKSTAKDKISPKKSSPKKETPKKASPKKSTPAKTGSPRKSA